MFHPSSTRPIWSDSAHVPHFGGTLSGAERRSFDVAIVGAGVTGLTAALRLAEAGKSVAVFELDRIGQGETAHTTAHLTEVQDLSFADLISHFGEAGAEHAMQAARKSIDLIESIARETGADCQFARVPGYRYSQSSRGRERFERELEAAHKLGAPCELLASAPLPFATAAALRFPQQAQFHPLRYLVALAAKAEALGCAFFEETRVRNIDEGERCRVETDRGDAFADAVIVAANVPVLNRFTLHPKLAAYRTYAMAVEIEGGWRPAGLYWDDENPYHYVRGATIDGADWLIVGGADHKTGQETSAERHFQSLDDWTRERFDVARVGRRWSGQVINSVDGLPFIGRGSASERVFVSTGYGGNGMTWGTLGGALVADLALGRNNPWQDLFDARRFKPIASARAFISENIDFPARMIADRFGRASGDKMDVLRENEGAIVRVGAKKVAAYRDPEGEIHLLSPVCPHLGCYVAWNDAEKSWDCPCHGSRFDPLGKLINGPAVADLASESRDDDPPFATEPAEAGERPPAGFGPPLLSMLSRACPCKTNKV